MCGMCCMTNTSDMFLAQCWRLETSPMPQCSLVLVCKDIIPKYERTRSKRFFSTVGTFSLTR